MENKDLLNVYVLRDSGECVYHQEYAQQEDKVQSDSTIMSGFLSAIEMFSNDVDTGADHLETNNYRFVYHKQNEFIYVARTKKHVDPKIYSEGLAKIATKMTQYIPEKFNGNVAAFEQMTEMVEDEFIIKSTESLYEFSGKYARDLKGDELKIYSYLRLKGRANLKTISQMMSIDQKRAFQITNELVEKEYLINHC
ncbi:MAG: hypothetical protein INQ03_01895 [Candidatus Heimdallarchaeota archaeon]|nr:hypothetical protein [Candidatus Heimdallarchaeota archaeon]